MGGNASSENTPAAAISRCSKWESRGFMHALPAQTSGVWCQESISTGKGNDWMECVDGVTKPANGALLYTGLCPSLMAKLGMLAKDQSLGEENQEGSIQVGSFQQSGSLPDFHDVTMAQCSEWAPRGFVQGRPSLTPGVWCQVGISAAEGNDWMECVDGVTKPGQGTVYTGLCPSSVANQDVSAKDQQEPDQKVAEDSENERSLQDATVNQCSSWAPRGFVQGRPTLTPGVWCQVGIAAAEGNAYMECVDGVTKPQVEGSLTHLGLCPSSLVGDIHV